MIKRMSEKRSVPILPQLLSDQDASVAPEDLPDEPGGPDPLPF